MLKNKKVGFGITGSFCSMEDMLKALDKLIDAGCDVYVFISDTIDKYNTRFNQASILIEKIEARINHPIIKDVVGAEVFGPKIPLDLMIVYPCTSNTLSKLTCGINDNAVTMACKCTIRNQKNVVLGIYTNDALASSGENIAKIINKKHYYVVPMYQDDKVKKPYSMIANVNKFIKTIGWSLNNKQVLPIFEGERDV